MIQYIETYKLNGKTKINISEEDYDKDIDITDISLVGKQYLIDSKTGKFYKIEEVKSVE